MTSNLALMETPNYGASEAAQYLRINAVDIRRWIDDGLIQRPEKGISFLNILELHVLKGLRKQYKLPMQRIRRALEEFSKTDNPPHPLLDRRLETDGHHLFLHEGEEYLNLNRSRQMGLPQILATYLKRISRTANGEIAAYYPFISSEDPEEPRTIQMSPGIAFGRPVLSGTGIAADVIAGRFRARDTISELAEEYGVSSSAIEDCVRWQLPQLNAA